MDVFSRSPSVVNTNASIPVVSIYAQSWPIPIHDTIATNKAFSSGRSLNDDWVNLPRKHSSHPLRTSSKKKGRVRSAPAGRYGTTVSNLFTDSEDEISDTVQEFKLTLQLFKRLTKQVREVNEYMNKHRIYSFKHSINNESIASPALRRSQLAAALSRREIPATQATNEPITDLGPPTITSRPAVRQERGCHSPVQRSPSTSSHPGSSLSHVYTRQPSTKSTSSGSTLDKKKENLQKADELAKERWIQNDKDFDELFTPNKIAPEDMDFKFHDPYPRTWVDETVEDACFRGSKKVDPFMHRLEELEALEEETVLWETLREEKNKQAPTENKQIISGNSKNTKIVSSRRGSARCPTGKTTPGSQLRRPKSSINKLKRTSSAGKGSTTSIQVSGSEESDITTFRNSGYTLGISFIPGSMYPETIKKQKEKTGDGPVVPVVSLSPYGSTPQQHLQIPKCDACHHRKLAGTKKQTDSKNNIPTLKAMQSQYELKATECYDIVGIAQTFDPPCKNTIRNGIKSKAKPSTAEKATKKGLVPGKSLHSQRRISLTSEGMAVRGINPALNPSRPATGKSVKSFKGSKCM